MCNILHLVLGCKNSHYEQIEDAARQTWCSLSPENVKVIFMYGNKGSIFWDEKDSFYVDKMECYSSNICLYKTILALDFFIESDFDYIFRSNNTGYFDLNLINKYLEDKPRTNFYSGIVGHHSESDFASGSGYFISKDIAKKIIEDKEIIYSYNLPGWCDDVSIGKYITQYLNIEIDSSSRRLDLSPNEINDSLDMSHYHYRIINKGDANSLYRIHKLKCQNP